MSVLRVAAFFAVAMCLRLRPVARPITVWVTPRSNRVCTEADNPDETLAEMTRYALSVRQLLEARERVRRASTVRVARPAPAPAAKELAAERLRDAGRR